MKLIQKHTFSSHVDRVGEVICAEDYNLEMYKLRQEVADATYRVVKQDQDHLTFEVRCQEYQRSKLGLLDKSKTTESVTNNEWDANSKTLSWDYHMESSSGRIRLTGIYHLHPEGENRTLLEHEMNIEVKIPLIGDKIAKFIMKDSEKDFTRFMQLIEKYLQ